MTTTEIAVIIAAVLAGSLVKSVTGMGFPIIAVPIMSLYTGPTTAIAVIAIPNAAQNLGIAWSHRAARSETEGLAAFCAIGIIGAVGGALTLGVIPEELTLSVLVIAIAAWVLQQLRRPDLRIPVDRRRLVGPWVGGLAGVFQGAAGISGPIVAAWHHGLRLSREAFVLSIATAFLLTGTAQTAVLAVRGDLDGRLGVSALLTVIVLATIPVGARLRSRLSGPTFERLVLALVAGSGIGILVDILSGIG
ncbi:MAG: sulfite exporter TauE/SafE family protein [Ilumatobacter sp.]